MSVENYNNSYQRKLSLKDFKKKEPSKKGGLHGRQVQAIPSTNSSTIRQVNPTNILGQSFAEVAALSKSTSTPSSTRSAFESNSPTLKQVDSSKNEEVESSTNGKKVTEENILNPSPRGRILESRISKFVHTTGVFGSYVCNEAKLFTTFVAAKKLGLTREQLKPNYEFPPNQWTQIAEDSSFKFSLACFNYETLSEIRKQGDKEQIKDLDANTAFINDLSHLSNGRIGWELHYRTISNDLNDGGVSLWHKSKRSYEEMIFFNPYAEPSGIPQVDKGKGTYGLMQSFFAYARTNLREKGVVTVMWNPMRKDGLEVVEIPKIAIDNNFRIVDMRCGKNIFKHYKNANSFNRAKEKGDSVVVASKPSDTVIFFKRVSMNKNIPASAIVSDALVHYLPKAEKCAAKCITDQEKNAADQREKMMRQRAEQEKKKSMTDEWVTVGKRK
ncbi:MAG: hypothetical protein JJU12_02240 [Chlamydiales bacterium]|nr:hypothetical protein [Chlamydiales bacterium]